MEKQFKKLGRELQEQGIAPERDLWPGIEKAISQEAPRRSFGLNAWLRLGAMAASVLLLVGSGYFGSGSTIGHQRDETGRLAGWTVSDHSQDSTLLYSLNQEILDLDTAMARDPENIKLSRLSLLAHKSRAHLMRAGIHR